MSMDNRAALDPQHSVVVEACAGSGKTWLLVSRIVRLLLDGVQPGEILAITFTRKAAQEMQARLHEWLHLLAVQDDAAVRQFLRERAVDDIDAALLSRARGLYRDALLAQPAITISTFHGWFMQIIGRAPLNAGVPVGMQLLERTAALRDEAWQAFADSLRTAPDGETAQFMQWLFAEYGLPSTRTLLENFVHKRAEWWAYSAGQEDAAGYAFEQLRNEFEVDMEFDPAADWGMCSNNEEMLFAFIAQLANKGTGPQKAKASELEKTWIDSKPEERFTKLWPLLFTQKSEPRVGSPFKPTAKQNEEAFLPPLGSLQASLQAVRDALAELEALRMNQAALHCGAALLEHYQELKLRAQQMDFTDLEWQVAHLLNRSDCAEYMQYKLDSRYKHVLLDEFQDTNPLQWQILQAWFGAAAAADSRPTVFVVGDPKQSIYRFRRADARLFGVVKEFMQAEFGAHYLTQNETRRNAPAVLGAVNGVFASLPDGFADFEEHIAHHRDLPGHVEALPLCVVTTTPPLPLAGEGWGEGLRNPLTTPREENESGARESEAEQFAAHIASIVANWSVQEEGGTLRRAEYRDIMVLVRKRTHLRVYEHALRARHIPFLTSRRGGLLDTLEAEDIQALLTFLITPFADLELAQALRSPLFACSDEDLIQLAEIQTLPNPPLSGREPVGDGNMMCAPSPDKGRAGEGFRWWARLKNIIENEAASPQLQRAHRLLRGWLQQADKLPVHDLLDRIYFEGDLVHRYAAALPAELRETVRANLQAFMEIALNVDAGRYPSLPRFLAELRELRMAENEAPDEGKVGEIGNALRIYTVHEAKGLEAPIVWLLDANDTQRKADSYGVLLDWQPDEPRPAHFSLYSDKRGRGAKRAPYFDADEAYARREEMNLLYVAMTRAKQALLVSGNGEAAATSWYGRIAQAAGQGGNPLLAAAGRVAPVPEKSFMKVDAALLHPRPTGQHAPRTTAEQRRGIWLHALLQHLTPPSPLTPLPQAGEGSAVAREREVLRQHCGIPASDFLPLMEQAQHLLTSPQLACFFDPQQYRNACNEMPYVNARGEMKRIDRLVEFDNEVWVLDYKLGDSENAARYRAQMGEYRSAMQAVYAGRTVRCALLFADGVLSEV
ncbi:MAG: UvrD-helicase domain-containing protein [Gallionella sp.]|nr:UvrD-helicase domain-containing protein [Gallionella sp.]